MLTNSNIQVMDQINNEKVITLDGRTQDASHDAQMDSDTLLLNSGKLDVSGSQVAPTFSSVISLAINTNKDSIEIIKGRGT